MDRDQVLFRLFGKYCPEGTILYTNGSTGEEVFFLQSGAARLAAPGEGGAVVVRDAGDIIGEECFFARAPRAARAEMTADSRLLQVSDRNLDSFVRQGPETGQRFLERLGARAGELWADLRGWMLGQAVFRAEHHLPLREGASALAPEELAERSGIGLYPAGFLLAELERLGALRREGRRYALADAAKMAEAVRRLASEGAGT